MPFANIDDTLQMHYHQDDFTPPWGEPAEAVVLQHGAGKSGKLWYFWSPYLATEHRVIRPDARGFGESSPIPAGFPLSLRTFARDLKRLLDRLGIDKAHFVGETIGGAISMQFAYEYPERVRTLTLIGAPYRPARNADHFHRGRKLIEEQGVAAWAYGQAERRFGKQADPAMVEWYCSEMSKTPRSTVLTLLEYVPTVDMTEVMPHIQAPTLVLGGAESEMNPIERRARPRS
jgi:pimeloyl-ACP methyl ester carboxylesterase